MRTHRRISTAAVSAALLLVLVAAPASAHVTVDPGEAVKGSFTKLALRVPNEEEKASTVEVAVQLPPGLDEVSTRPVPGWTAAVSGSVITWSGGQIRPGEFQEFELSLQLPTTDTVVFKAVQTYDDGTIVRWIDPVPAKGPEPEHPVPTLHLVAASAAGLSAATPDDGGDGNGGVVGAYGLGAVAVLLAAAALVLARRRPTST